jgi:putative oxidoreductase
MWRKDRAIPMESKTHEWLVFVLRWFLAVVFIFAGVGKILDPTLFAEDIDNYRLLPYVLVTIMAAIMPWLEVLCGFLLIVGKWIKGAALLLFAMNLVFIGALSSALVRGLDINCGCFALTNEVTKVGFSRLVEDTVFLIVSAIIYYRSVLTDFVKGTDKAEQQTM